MGCSEGLARIFVFVTNFAFVLVGLALLVVGILYKVSLTKYTDAIPPEYDSLQYVPTIAIIIGAIIFFIAFLGCCGALRGNTCMLSTYGSILILIFVLQIALGIFAFVQISDKNDLENKIANQIRILFTKYDSNNEAREVVDLIQQNFHCCGTTGPSFWGQTVPRSCYADSSNQPFNVGCSNVVPEFLWNSIKVVGIVALGVAVVEVIGAVLALCLSGCIRERRRQGAYY